ncbi:MAG: single-stranded DNA-binding protein [Muribaculaceae bacterium]|nr:single-stranded DNA-binding protein [Muribaculaceae bacterium]
MSINKVILIGNVGCDPQVRFVDKRPVAAFTMATTERGYTNAAGVEIPPRTEWHNIIMWDRAAEFAEKYIRKGTKLFVEGKLRTRTWEDRAAIKRTVTEIYVENYDLLSRNT